MQVVVAVLCKTKFELFVRHNGEKNDKIALTPYSNCDVC